MLTKTFIQPFLGFEPAGKPRQSDVWVPYLSSISPAILMLCVTLFVGPLDRMNQAGALLHYPANLNSSFRLGGVGPKAALGPSGFPGRSAARFLSHATLLLSAAAAATNAESSSGEPGSRMSRPHATMSHPVGDKNYLVYLFIAFALLAATAVTLLWDIRRKSRSGKRGDTPSS